MKKQRLSQIFIYTLIAFFYGYSSSQAEDLEDCRMDKRLSVYESLNSIDSNKTPPFYGSITLSCASNGLPADTNVVYCYNIAYANLQLSRPYRQATLYGGNIALTSHINFNIYSQEYGTGTYVPVSDTTQFYNIFGKASYNKAQKRFFFTSPLKVKVEQNGKYNNNPPNSGVYYYGMAQQGGGNFKAYVHTLAKGEEPNYRNACGGKQRITGTSLSENNIDIKFDTKPSCAVFTMQNLNFGRHINLRQKVTANAIVKISCSPDLQYDYTIDEIGDNKSADGVFRMRASGVSQMIPYTITPTFGSGISGHDGQEDTVIVHGVVDATNETFPPASYKDILVVTLTHH